MAIDRRRPPALTQPAPHLCGEDLGLGGLGVAERFELADRCTSREDILGQHATPARLGVQSAYPAACATLIVARSVQLSVDDKVIRVHPIRPDRSRQLGTLANPKGQPRRSNAAS